MTHSVTFPPTARPLMPNALCLTTLITKVAGHSGDCVVNTLRAMNLVKTLKSTTTSASASMGTGAMSMGGMSGMTGGGTQKESGQPGLVLSDHALQVTPYPFVLCLYINPDSHRTSQPTTSHRSPRCTPSPILQSRTVILPSNYLPPL